MNSFAQLAKSLTYGLLAASLLLCSKKPLVTKSAPLDKLPPLDSSQKLPANFIHRSGRLLQDSLQQIFLIKGISFGNEVWTDKEIPSTHHSEIDFQRVRDMGMNAIRFYMNYKTFENDLTPYQYKLTGWDWLDQNVAWAKKYGIRLILNMHVPQGGFQSNGKGNALWDIPQNQQRLVALWKAIAKRYNRETQIIGFGLVNEPAPSTSKEQWQSLAQSLVQEIRQVDKNHLIFVERASPINGAYTQDADLNFPLLTDPNLVYEFHCYDPFEFTHQLLSFGYQADGGKYPDETRVSLGNSTFYTATFNNPTSLTSTSDWQFYEGIKYTIADPKIKVANLSLVGAGVKGTVYFDDIVVKEYDPNGVFTRDVFTSTVDSLNGWSYWSSNQTGQSGLSVLTGHSHQKSLFISGATADCNLGNYQDLFIPKQNFSYQISGWMKGENIDPSATCRLRIDFLTSSDPIQTRNKQLLHASLDKYTRWAKTKDVPLYLGEFGANFNSFLKNKGGLAWVGDMIDLSLASQIGFTYHAYHEDSFGLYYGYGMLPDPGRVNQPLIDLFRARLKK